MLYIFRNKTSIIPTMSRLEPNLNKFDTELTSMTKDGSHLIQKFIIKKKIKFLKVI